MTTTFDTLKQIKAWPSSSATPVPFSTNAPAAYCMPWCLQPRNNTMSFPIPPVLDQPASILQSDKETRGLMTFNSSSAVVESAGTVIIYWPSLILTLIPVEEFGSCFVVQFIQGKENVLIIVVHKDHQQGIHIGNNPLEGAKWQELKGTNYFSTNRSISSTTVVWHASAKMAVYQIYKQDNSSFGNPAPVVSANPDFRGCVVTPEVTKILNESQSWQESIRSCQKQNLNLISISSEALQNKSAKICVETTPSKRGSERVAAR
ncbi:uncharacterized protein LOC129380043 isoform X1 [Poeciliopsis prolifica]|uniref:uncharacterized protein LOC129380043 isoform X1 n=1 Tax=Poeciliopsis prolifica TaxID=188132 RepID=UPI0024145C40|nr:uncharacterized protein LOC129380043 isoform X1 [Poeciliopsis prolifica]